MATNRPVALKRASFDATDKHPAGDLAIVFQRASGLPPAPAFQRTEALVAEAGPDLRRCIIEVTTPDLTFNKTPVSQRVSPPRIETTFPHPSEESQLIRVFLE